ncbi:DUF1028 domain-containing protein [Paracoccus liaowanqingii]|uniref:DUF1028 domain-containing protein n=1 Tax=Paracoccus liaowanqingii TaxID=2560053 RepID=UPI00143D1B3F|nr:DUF1028 domain-containing protein [Paracoccus liaowanqingii]
MKINTYSIVARCGRSRELGAAVASAVPAVGAICLRLRPNIGAVSTQSWVNPYLAESALDAMARGLECKEALTAALANDPAASMRQIGVIGATGNGAAWTGAECTDWAGQIVGKDFAVQGNMLTGSETINAMAQAFTASIDLPLDERLMRSLEAAQAVGGDKRGRQSAALAVNSGEAYARIDLRVDEHPDPVAELRRILTIATAQLAPFIAGMPRAAAPPQPAPTSVVEMLLKSPPNRPSGGGSREP